MTEIKSLQDKLNAEKKKNAAVLFTPLPHSPAAFPSLIDSLSFSFHSYPLMCLFSPLTNL